MEDVTRVFGVTGPCVCVQTSINRLYISYGCKFISHSIDSRSSTINFTLEFENTITHICCTDSQFILLVDSANMMHFIAAEEGVLVCSYPLKRMDILIYLSSLQINSTDTGATTRSFYFIFNTGDILEIGNFPCGEISIEPKSFTSLLSRLSFRKKSIGCKVARAQVLLQNELASYIYLDENQGLNLMSYDEHILLGSGCYSDFVYIRGLRVIIALTQKGCLHIIDTTSGKVVCREYIFSSNSIIIGLNLMPPGVDNNSTSAVIILQSASMLSSCFFGIIRNKYFIIPCGPLHADYKSIYPIGKTSSSEIDSSIMCQGKDSRLLRLAKIFPYTFTSFYDEKSSLLYNIFILKETANPQLADLDFLTLLKNTREPSELFACLTQLVKCAPPIIDLMLNPLLESLDRIKADPEFESSVQRLISALSSALEINREVQATVESILIDQSLCWKMLLSNGNLTGSSIVFRNHLHRVFPCGKLEALECVPQSVNAYEFSSWIQSDLLSQFYSISDDERMSLTLALIKRALYYESTNRSPSDALLVITVTLKLCSIFTDRQKEFLDIRNECENIKKCLNLLCGVEQNWGISVSISDFRQQGPKGLIFDFLTLTHADKVAEVISSKIRPAVDSSWGIDLDSLIFEWVENVASSTIFVDAEERELEQGDAFTKLVNAVAAISVSEIKASAILLLMQLPISTSGPGSSLDGTKTLIILAETMCTALLSKSKDGIVEALRLYKLRSIASNYGISKFDIRNQQQVRAVVNTILSQSSMKSSIEDAIKFAESWSSTSMNISFILTRALVLRASDIKTTSAIKLSYINQIMLHIQKLPQMSAIVEDALNSLMCFIDNLFKDCESCTIGELPTEVLRQSFASAIESAFYIASSYIDFTSDSSLLNTKIDAYVESSIDLEYLSNLKALLALNIEFNIYLPAKKYLSQEACKSVVELLAKRECREILSRLDDDEKCFVSPLTPSCRRACSLLKVSSALYLYIILKELLSFGSDSALNAALIITDTINTELGGYSFVSDDESLIAVDSARRICAFAAAKSQKGDFQASQMALFEPFKVSQLNLRLFLEICAYGTLGKSIDLFSAADLVLTISYRLDTDLTYDQSVPFRICETNYAKDGILMNAEEVLIPVFSFSLKEMERRSKFLTVSNDIEDIEALVDLMQRSENHLIATRIISSSWGAVTSKASMLRNSWLPLSRKILSYREVDTLLAASCLSCLPYDLLVRELKAVIPTVQSDYARLRSVAIVGEELSRLWNKEDMLIVFEGLQSNCRWLNQLQTLNIKVDMKAYNSPDSVCKDAYIRSLVPELLKRAGMKLDLIVEYCRQYNIESDFATLCYVEQCLLSPPQSNRNETLWRADVKFVASGADDMVMLKLLRKLLIKIHSVDFEKIAFVCSWLIDILTEDTVHSQAISPTSSNSSNDAEIETYVRYNEVLAVIQNLSLPSFSDIRLMYSHVYSGLSGIHFNRLPLWQLLEDPFGVMEKALNSSPELSVKLFPICNILQLDRDDFIVRKFRSAYSSRRFSLARKMAVESVSSESLYSGISDELKLISSKVIKIETLKWISDFERDENPEWSLFILEKAVEYSGDKNLDEEMDEMRGELLSDLLKFKCEQSLKILMGTSNLALDSVSKYSSLCSDPSALVRQILISSQEEAWNLQLGAYESDGNILSTYVMQQQCFTIKVAEYIEAVGDAVDQIYESSNIWVISENCNFLEATRKQLILDLVSSRGDESTGQENSSHDWGVLTIDSELNPSLAEIRRRDDLYAGFSIAVLIESCKDSTIINSYIKKLIDVSIDKSSKLSHRSRYRAAQALCILKPTAYREQNISNYRDFHSCMSEIKVIRLTCNSDALFSSIRDSTEIRPIVSTLLHDEGYHEEVSEICRDILLVCNVTDDAIWIKLVQHMLKNGHKKAAWHSLSILSACNTCILRSVLSSSIRLDVLKLMISVMSECYDKLIHIIANPSERAELAETISLVHGTRIVNLIHKQASGKIPRELQLSTEDHVLGFKRLALLASIVLESCSNIKSPSKEESTEIIMIVDVWKRIALCSLRYLIHAEETDSSHVYIICSRAKHCMLQMMTPSLILSQYSRVYSASCLNLFVKDLFTMIKSLITNSISSIKRDVHVFDVLVAICVAFNESIFESCFAECFHLPADMTFILWLLKYIRLCDKSVAGKCQVVKVLMNWMSLNRGVFDEAKETVTTDERTDWDSIMSYLNTKI